MFVSSDFSLFPSHSPRSVVPQHITGTCLERFGQDAHPTKAPSRQPVSSRGLDPIAGGLS